LTKNKPGMWAAGCSGMITTLLVMIAAGSALLFTEIIAASDAPLGYEDESGFHFGNPVSPDPNLFDFQSFR
jgi:hypothetical protein